MTSAARLPAIDSHHHFWDPNMGDYPWMVGPVLPIRRVFTPDDMRPLLAPAGVQKTILVQTWSNYAESQAFLALAKATDFIAGVLAWVDLEAADVAERLSTTVDLVRDAIAGLDEESQRAVLWTAAAEAYRLNAGHL